MKLTIIIPNYNEVATISQVLERVQGADISAWEKEVIVVDDGSTDTSLRLLEQLTSRYDFMLLKHAQNLGKGAAVRTGLTAATGDYILIQDADLEYSPAEFGMLLAALGVGVDAVFGSRMMQGVQGGYAHYIWGARVLNTVANILFGSRLTDVYTCYKLVPAAFFAKVPIESQGFEFESELVSRLLMQGLKIKEVPITYAPRTFSQGKKIRPWDAWKGIYTMIGIRFFGQ